MIKQDPDLSLIAIGTQNNAADIFLNSPEVNTTVFAPTNLATVRGMYEYGKYYNLKLAPSSRLKATG